MAELRCGAKRRRLDELLADTAFFAFFVSATDTSDLRRDSRSCLTTYQSVIRLWRTGGRVHLMSFGHTEWKNWGQSALLGVRDMDKFAL